MGFEKRQHDADQSMSVFSFSFLNDVQVMIEQRVSNGKTNDKEEIISTKT